MSKERDKGLVLVTGGSGFVGSHCILQLLEAGYTVRTTVRSLKREEEVREMMRRGGLAEPLIQNGLSFAVADLTSDAGWVEAVAGCEFVLHVASPFPLALPKHEDELIIPAREGTLRVLRAARDAGVKRVVVTSSFAAIGYGHVLAGQTFTETDWTDVKGADVSAYAKSKTLAERAAWDFMAREGGALELAVVNPVGVFGPVLGADFSSSIQIVERLLKGSLPALPRISTGLVDVRDVADLHLRAMIDPAAAGERFLAVAEDFMSLPELARTLKKRLGTAGKKVPTRVMPDWLMKIVARFDPSVALIVPELGKVRSSSNAKARKLLGWSPRSNEECLMASAESVIALGV